MLHWFYKEFKEVTSYCTDVKKLRGGVSFTDRKCYNNQDERYSIKSGCRNQKVLPTGYDITSGGPVRSTHTHQPDVNSYPGQTHHSPWEKDVAVLSPAAIDDRELFDFLGAQSIVFSLFLCGWSHKRDPLHSRATLKIRFKIKYSEKFGIMEIF